MEGQQNLKFGRRSVQKLVTLKAKWHFIMAKNVWVKGKFTCW